MNIGSRNLPWIPSSTRPFENIFERILKSLSEFYLSLRPSLHSHSSTTTTVCSIVQDFCFSRLGIQFHPALVSDATPTNLSKSGEDVYTVKGDRRRKRAQLFRTSDAMLLPSSKINRTHPDLVAALTDEKISLDNQNGNRYDSPATLKRSISL
jgi:hypothetical protein